MPNKVNRIEADCRRADSPLGAFARSLANLGGDSECGETEGIGWHALLNGPFEDAEYHVLAIECGLTETEYREDVRDCAGIIARMDGAGFFYPEAFASKAKLFRAWRGIVRAETKLNRTEEAEHARRQRDYKAAERRNAIRAAKLARIEASAAKLAERRARIEAGAPATMPTHAEIVARTDARMDADLARIEAARQQDAETMERADAVQEGGIR